jgi:Transposase DNA-binding
MSEKCWQKISGKAAVATWVETETAQSDFGDERLAKRFHQLLSTMGGSMGDSIPLACADWANTKAAYRFLSNDRVNEYDILSGHFQSTRERSEAINGPLLVLHDTTEFSYQREQSDKVGIINTIKSGHRYGSVRYITTCGILMHSSLAITPEGLPLGISAVKFWTRDKFKGTAALKRHVNPTRIPIETKESIRWLENMHQTTQLLGSPERLVHIGDRESDIYELFCEAEKLGTRFLVRTAVNRLAGEGDTTVEAMMKASPIDGWHPIDVHDSKGGIEKATLAIKYKTMTIQPPIGKEKSYPPLTLTVINAKERNAPAHRKKIDWKLVTNLSVRSFEEAVAKLGWYAMRWKIEVYHKILKSGCRAEESKLRTAQRLANLIALFSILSWRVFWITMLNRVAPKASAGIAFTRREIDILASIAGGRSFCSISSCVCLLARLGGYLARANDPPPGNMVIWRGLTRLADIEFGTSLQVRNMGN